MTLSEAKERIRRLEATVGELPEGCSDLVVMALANAESVASIQAMLDDLLQDLEALKMENAEVIRSQQATIRSLEVEIGQLKRAAVQPHEESSVSKIKVPEPKQFSGCRNAKELENFLWDMEQYFRAAKVPGGEQVSLTSMYLVEDAKLWWRTRMEDDLSANRPGITTWESLKKELKDQFLPCNTSWVAREALKRLKHSGSIREYVKEFSSLMLDIKNMSEEDKLFNFTSGLQPWAQAELRRQGVKDIPSAMAAAEGLVDFRMATPSTTADKEKSAEGKKWKGKPKKRFTEKEDDDQKDQVQVKAPFPPGCFICGGPHRARVCPKKEKIAAIISDEVAEEDVSPARVNPLLLLNAISGEQKAAKFSNLLYCTAQINGMDVRAMLDTGATNNFVSKREANRLRLNLLESSSAIKAVNSGVVPVCGAAEVSLRLGTWQGRCCVMVIPLDDFDLILGMEFFVKAKVILMPHLKGIIVGDEGNPCFIKLEELAGDTTGTSSISSAGGLSHPQHPT